MIATLPGQAPNKKWWRELLELLAVPLAMSAVMVMAWFANGARPLGGTTDGELITALAPISWTLSALSILRSPTARSLVLPTPIMMWAMLMSLHKTEASWLWCALANVAWLGLLGACWKGERRLARLATVSCGALALWLQLAAFVHY